MDLIAQALAKRANLRDELQRVEAFLTMAYELQGQSGGQSLSVGGNSSPLTGPRQTKRAPAGVGAETARVAAEIIRDANRAMTTRELTPLIEAHGIEISGKDKVATLSARLGNDAKRDDGHLKLIAGKWHLLEWISDAGKEEAADTPSKDASAASHLSNQGGQLWNRLNQ